MERIYNMPDLYSNKGIMFYSAPTEVYKGIFRGYNIRSILISYWYIRNRLSYFNSFVDYLKDVDGIIMIDSGAHTFKSDAKNFAHWTKPDSYTAYINEYLEFCYKYADKIFCCVNIDMDNWVGVDVVDRWNHDYFKPLAKKTNVIFNVDSKFNRKGVKDNTGGLIRMREYLKEFDYIGINRKIANTHSATVFRESQLAKVKVHGFAVTSLSILNDYPFFSVDSTSWMAGAMYGVTYNYDGANFKTYDPKKKIMRRNQRLKAIELGINHEKLEADSTYEVTQFNLAAWRGFEYEYMKAAKLKSKLLNVGRYDKRGIR